MGSNLGNRKAYLRDAIKRLPDLQRISKVYETDPVGYLDQGAFLNLVAELDTQKSARELLKICQAEEHLAERQRTIKDGPRTLDLDLLWVDGQEVNEPDLLVPHPRMFERGFVMFPLNDLAPDIAGSWIEKASDEDKKAVREVGMLDLNPIEPTVLTQNASLTEILNGARNNEFKSIGFVPTLGGLHKGHISLINASLKETDLTVVSIFLNPLQFNQPADLQSYPCDMDRDIEILTDLGVELIFTPGQDEIYPPGQQQLHINFGEGPLMNSLEAKYRPGHLEGVLRVVAKLFGIVGKSKAYFGEKDYQQLLSVNQLVKAFSLPVEIEACPTIRDPDGLALSSRNALLNKDMRQASLQIYKILKQAKEMADNGETNTARIEKFMRTQAKKAAGVKPEYFVVRDALTFEPVSQIKKPVRLLAAAIVGNVRLIDNLEVSL